MLVIGILSLFAAFSFRRVLAEKGYAESNAWWFPMIAGLIIYAFSFVLTALVEWKFNTNATSDAEGRSVYSFVVSIFAICLHAAVVGKLWRQIKKLPPR